VAAHAGDAEGEKGLAGLGYKQEWAKREKRSDFCFVKHNFYTILPNQFSNHFKFKNLRSFRSLFSLIFL